MRSLIRPGRRGAHQVRRALLTGVIVAAALGGAACTPAKRPKFEVLGKVIERTTTSTTNDPAAAPDTTPSSSAATGVSTTTSVAASAPGRVPPSTKGHPAGATTAKPGPAVPPATAAPSTTVAGESLAP